MKYKIIKTSSLLQKYLIELQKYIIERNEFLIKDKIIQSHNICSSLDNFIPHEPVPTFISFKYFKFMNDFCGYARRLAKQIAKS